MVHTVHDADTLNHRTQSTTNPKIRNSRFRVPASSGTHHITSSASLPIAIVSFRLILRAGYLPGLVSLPAPDLGRATFEIAYLDGVPRLDARPSMPEEFEDVWERSGCIPGGAQVFRRRTPRLEVRDFVFP